MADRHRGQSETAYTMTTWSTLDPVAGTGMNRQELINQSEAYWRNSSKNFGTNDLWMECKIVAHKRHGIGNLTNLAICMARLLALAAAPAQSLSHQRQGVGDLARGFGWR